METVKFSALGKVVGDEVPLHAVDKEALKSKHVFVEGDDDESLIAISAYKTLRTNVLRGMNARKTRGVLVTSPAKGAGKSVTAANLAVSLARMPDHEVLLVDLDLRSPSVADNFGLQPETGIDNAADSGFELHSSIVKTDIPRLSILPCTGPHHDSSEVLLSRPVSSLIRLLQREDSGYYVVFDAPPILGCDDVAAIAPIVDLCLLVVGEGQTSKRELRHALENFPPIDMAGVLLNKSRKKFFKQYYYG